MGMMKELANEIDPKTAEKKELEAWEYGSVTHKMSGDKYHVGGIEETIVHGMEKHGVEPIHMVCYYRYDTLINSRTGKTMDRVNYDEQQMREFNDFKKLFELLPEDAD